MIHKRIRVIDLETAGGGPYDVCEIGWQDVTRGSDGRWSVDESAVLSWSIPVARSRPTRWPPPSAMSTWRELPLEADRAVRPARPWRRRRRTRGPSGQLRDALLHPSAQRRSALDLHLEMRAEALAGPALPRFSNQDAAGISACQKGSFTRSAFPATQRAMPDAYVTAHHLRDMLNEAPLETLLLWSEAAFRASAARPSWSPGPGQGLEPVFPNRR